MNPLKNLYEWVLSWAESVYGTLVLFLVAFAESSFFPVPADPLLMALCLGKVKKSMYYVFMCTLGSVLGGIFGFIIGYFLWYSPAGELTGVANFFFRVIPGFTPEVFDNVGALIYSTKRSVGGTVIQSFKEYDSGIYTLKVTNEKVQYMQKIIVTK